MTTSTPCLNVANNLLSMISPQAWTSAPALSIYSPEPYIGNFGANQGHYVGRGAARRSRSTQVAAGAWRLSLLP